MWANAAPHLQKQNQTLSEIADNNQVALIKGVCKESADVLLSVLHSGVVQGWLLSGLLLGFSVSVHCVHDLPVCLYACSVSVAQGLPF